MKSLLTILALLVAIPGYCAADSTITPLNGIAGITATSDTTNDTLRLNSFLEIGAVTIMDIAEPANLLTVSMEEGDFNTYVVVRYNLLSYKGTLLYTNRYLIAGSCYDYFKQAGVNYIFWKICVAKGFAIAE